MAATAASTGKGSISAAAAGAGGFFLKKLNMGLGWVAGIDAGQEAAAIIAVLQAL